MIRGSVHTQIEDLVMYNARWVLRTFLLSGPLLLFAGVCRADETVTVDGAVVTIAQDWKQTAIDDTVILTPSDLPAGMACTFTLLGGEAFDGSLGDRLASEWKEFEQLGSVLSDDKGNISGVGNPVEIAGRAGVIQVKPGVAVHVWLIIAGANHRIERMVFVTNSPEAFAKYGPAVTGMINGIKYVVPPPPKPLAGVCFGFAQVKTATQFECWIFLPDGVAYTGFPIGGPANMDLDFQRKRRTGEFGEYRTEGNQVLVTMKDKANPIRFAPVKSAWAASVTRPFQDRRSGVRGNTLATWTDQVPTTLRITQADPCDGLKLSATYRLDALELSFKPKPIPTIKFTADGEFSEDGLIRIADPGTFKEGGGVIPSAMPPEGGRGKYAIAKNTLNLIYQDGTKLSLTFFVTADDLAKSTSQTIFMHRSKLLLVP